MLGVIQNQKNNYYGENYKFWKRSNLTKYNREDGKTILDPEDDVAHVVLGGKWHIPTKEQIQELLDNTTIKKSKLNGVKGRLFKSKINGNTLFFPYSGIKVGSSVYGREDGCCYYWSSSIHKISPNRAMGSDSDLYGLRSCDRNCGLFVRGVFDKK